jgi:hypothetical protein
MAEGDDTDRDAPALVPIVSRHRMQRLRRQHGELLAKVRHKRAALARLRAEAEPIGRDLEARSASVRAEQRACDQHIHAAFAAIERDPRLRRADRAAARSLYQWLQSAGAISPGHADAPSSAVATTAEPHRALRPTFLRLASEYHPDKTTDEDRRAAHTEIMKELNRAYAGGDVSHLLELERTLGDQAGAIDTPATLESQVVALRAQLRDMSQEMRGLRAQFKGVMVIEFRRLTQAGCADPIGAIIDELRQAAAQTRRLLDLVDRFRAGDIDLDELYDGPAPAPDDDGRARWLADVFAAAREARRTSPGRRR